MGGENEKIIPSSAAVAEPPKGKTTSRQTLGNLISPSRVGDGPQKPSPPF